MENTILRKRKYKDISQGTDDSVSDSLEPRSRMDQLMNTIMGAMFTITHIWMSIIREYARALSMRAGLWSLATLGRIRRALYELCADLCVGLWLRATLRARNIFALGYDSGFTYTSVLLCSDREPGDKNTTIDVTIIYKMYKSLFGYSTLRDFADLIRNYYIDLVGHHAYIVVHTATYKHTCDGPIHLSNIERATFDASHDAYDDYIDDLLGDTSSNADRNLINGRKLPFGSLECINMCAQDNTLPEPAWSDSDDENGDDSSIVVGDNIDNTGNGDDNSNNDSNNDSNSDSNNDSAAVYNADREDTGSSNPDIFDIVPQNMGTITEILLKIKKSRQ